MTARSDTPRPFGLRLLSWLRPEEWLMVAFGLFLATLTSITEPEYGWRGLLRTFRWALTLSRQRDIPFFSSHMAFFLLLGIGAYGFFLALAVVRPQAGGRTRSLKTRSLEFLWLLRSYLPFLACYAIYALLRDMIPHLKVTPADTRLARMEFDLFGTLAATGVYRALASPEATWALAKAYASHFYAPPLVAFLLFVRRDFARFRNFMLAIAISAFAAYLGYLLVPAGGPRYAVAEWASIRASQSGDATLRFMDFWAETAADCFPSLHTAWTVITAIFLARFSRVLFAIYLPVGAGLITACLYFGYHYLIDLPAGALVAVLSVGAASTLHRWWYARVKNLTEPVR